jgi:hypothetical protein
MCYIFIYDIVSDYLNFKYQIAYLYPVFVYYDENMDKSAYVEYIQAIHIFIIVLYSIKIGTWMAGFWFATKSGSSPRSENQGQSHPSSPSGPPDPDDKDKGKKPKRQLKKKNHDWLLLIIVILLLVSVGLFVFLPIIRLFITFIENSEDTEDEPNGSDLKSEDHMDHSDSKNGVEPLIVTKERAKMLFWESVFTYRTDSQIRKTREFEFEWLEYIKKNNIPFSKVEKEFENIEALCILSLREEVKAFQRNEGMKKKSIIFLYIISVNKCEKRNYNSIFLLSVKI